MTVTQNRRMDIYSYPIRVHRLRLYSNCCIPSRSWSECRLFFTCSATHFRASSAKTYAGCRGTAEFFCHICHNHEADCHEAFVLYVSENFWNEIWMKRGTVGRSVFSSYSLLCQRFCPFCFNSWLSNASLFKMLVHIADILRNFGVDHGADYTKFLKYQLCVQAFWTRTRY